jgi:predicted transcriptional regulator of viral defense system
MEDIQIDGMKPANLRQQMKTLSDSGKIRRYEKGIYYIPQKTYFQCASAPNAEIVAQYKYISRNGTISGYYSGHTFANRIGISEQVPMKREIVSNHVAAIVKEVTIGKQTFILRRSKVFITQENAPILQLLDLLKNLGDYLDGDYHTAREKITNYIFANKITKEEIDRYIRNYPDSTFRYYYEMRLDNVFTQK